jgi:hypothetical protein
VSRCVEERNQSAFCLHLLHLDLNRCAASYSTHTSQSTNASTSCTSKCVLLLGSGNTLRESPKVRLHAAAGLMALLAVQNRPPEFEKVVMRLSREASEYRSQMRIDNIRPERTHIGNAHLPLIGLLFVAVAGGGVELGAVEVRCLCAQLGWKVARVVVPQTQPELH